MNVNAQAINSYDSFLQNSATSRARASISPETSPKMEADPIQPVTNQIEALSGTQANVAAIQTEDTMLGSLLDILA